MDGLAALAMPRHCGGPHRAGQVLVAPVHERSQHGLQRPAGLGEHVLRTGTLSLFLVGPGRQHTDVDQRPQPGGQHRRGRAGRLPYPGEAAVTERHLSNDEQRPTLADDLEGARDRTGTGHHLSMDTEVSSV